MDEEVVKYLPEAFAFVYVIKTDNAGGVQKDRVSVKNNHHSQMATIYQTVRSPVEGALIRQSLTHCPLEAIKPLQ